MTRKQENGTCMVQYHERCKACGFCILECSKDALSFSTNVNKKGYTTVSLEEDKCIACGICYTVCPDYVFERREVN